MTALTKARDAASRYLTARGYAAEARVVAEGAGDDFAEVRIALAVVADAQKRLHRYETALAAYAEADFWDGDTTSAAADDRGRIARRALAGADRTTARADHRD